MRGRARKIRAARSVSSRSGVGTEVQLTIPANLAFAAKAGWHPVSMRLRFAEEN